MAVSADWNACLAFEGKERLLPTGANMPPAVDVMKLVKRWVVLDAEEDAGYRTVRLAELKPGDSVVGAEINMNSLDRVLATYTDAQFEFKSTEGTFSITGWIERYKTNPFEVLAVMRKNRAMSGGGIKF